MSIRYSPRDMANISDMADNTMKSHIPMLMPIPMPIIIFKTLSNTMPIHDTGKVKCLIKKKLT